MQSMARQAKTFTGEELLDYYRMPSTPENLADKVYAVIAISFAGRGVEVAAVNSKNITQTTETVTGEKHIKVTYIRSKTRGVPEQSYTLITGSTEVRIINEYEQCFKREERNGGRREGVSGGEKNSKGIKRGLVYSLGTKLLVLYAGAWCTCYVCAKDGPTSCSSRFAASSGLMKNGSQLRVGTEASEVGSEYDPNGGGSAI